MTILFLLFTILMVHVAYNSAIRLFLDREPIYITLVIAGIFVAVINADLFIQYLTETLQ